MFPEMIAGLEDRKLPTWTVHLTLIIKLISSHLISVTVFVVSLCGALACTFNECIWPAREPPSLLSLCSVPDIPLGSWGWRKYNTFISYENMLLWNKKLKTSECKQIIIQEKRKVSTPFLPLTCVLSRSLKEKHTHHWTKKQGARYPQVTASLSFAEDFADNFLFWLNDV